MAATAAEKAAAAREAAVRKAAEKAKASERGKAARCSEQIGGAGGPKGGRAHHHHHPTPTADADDRQLSKEFIASVKHSLTSSSGGRPYVPSRSPYVLRYSNSRRREVRRYQMH